jgi:hypothetical protein
MSGALSLLPPYGFTLSIFSYRMSFWFSITLSTCQFTYTSNIVWCRNRNRSTAAQLRGLRFRIPLGAWMFISCVCVVWVVASSRRVVPNVGVSLCVWWSATVRVILYTYNGVGRKVRIKYHFRLGRCSFEIKNEKDLLIEVSVSSPVVRILFSWRKTLSWFTRIRFITCQIWCKNNLVFSCSLSSYGF